jgi:general secretion pathway protein G
MKTETKVIIFVFLVIILLFAALSPIPMTPPRYSIDKAKCDSTKPKMVPIKAAIEAYHLNTSQYPVKLEDLLTSPKGLENLWKGPYLKESQLYDPWNNLFIYKLDTSNPNGYILISYGAEGTPGGDGYNADIIND